MFFSRDLFPFSTVCFHILYGVTAAKQQNKLQLVVRWLELFFLAAVYQILELSWCVRMWSLEWHFNQAENNKYVSNEHFASTFDVVHAGSLWRLTASSRYKCFYLTVTHTSPQLFVSRWTQLIQIPISLWAKSLHATTCVFISVCVCVFAYSLHNKNAGMESDAAALTPSSS